MGNSSKSKFWAKNCLKMADFTLLEYAKPISRKISVIENLCVTNESDKNQ